MVPFFSTTFPVCSAQADIYVITTWTKQYTSRLKGTIHLLISFICFVSSFSFGQIWFVIAFQRNPEVLVSYLFRVEMS